MSKLLNSDSSPFVRGLLLGELIAKGEPLTTAAIRLLTGVSKATAKRDLLAIETTMRTEVEFTNGQRRCVRRDKRRPSLAAYLAGGESAPDA